VLARRQVLVVLDNCEHAAEAAAELREGPLLAADDVRVRRRRWRIDAGWARALSARAYRATSPGH